MLNKYLPLIFRSLVIATLVYVASYVDFYSETEYEKMSILQNNVVDLNYVRVQRPTVAIVLTNRTVGNPSVDPSILHSWRRYANYQGYKLFVLKTSIFALKAQLTDFTWVMLVDEQIVPPELTRPLPIEPTHDLILLSAIDVDTQYVTKFLPVALFQSCDWTLKWVQTLSKHTHLTHKLLTDLQFMVRTSDASANVGATTVLPQSKIFSTAANDVNMLDLRHAKHTSEPAVAVGITGAYGVDRRVLFACVDSIAAQTSVPNIVVIALSNIPDKGYAELSMALSRRLLGIPLLLNGSATAQSVETSRSWITQNVNTDYIAFVEEDCLLHSERLKYVRNAIVDHNKLHHVSAHTNELGNKRKSHPKERGEVEFFYAANKNVLQFKAFSRIAYALQRPIGAQVWESTTTATNYWNEYRIGDIFEGIYGAPACERFPSSLGCAYNTRKMKQQDFHTLLKILYSWRVWPAADTNSVIIHLRLGDGLCAQNDPHCAATTRTVRDCWRYDSDCFTYKQQRYAFSSRWYNSIANALSRAQPIVVVSDDDHWTRFPDPRGADRSTGLRYKQNLITFFKANGFNVVEHHSTTPDNDFAFMAAAKVFVKGGGGYSRLVARVVEARGGTVYEPSEFNFAHIWSHMYTAPTTIVTAFYDIPSKHSQKQYLEWMKNMLSLKDAMVVFTDRVHTPTILKYRAHARRQTYIVTEDLNATKTAKLFDTYFWQAQLQKDPEKKIHRDFRLYWIWNEKTNWLKRVVDANPFKSSFFAWVDIGYCRTQKYNNKIMLRKIPKSLRETQVVLLSTPFSNLLAGGFIGGYAEGIQMWNQQYYSTLLKLKHTFIGKDQSTMFRTCENNPKLCFVVKGSTKFGNRWFYMLPYMMGLTRSNLLTNIEEMRYIETNFKKVMAASTTCVKILIGIFFKKGDAREQAFEEWLPLLRKPQLQCGLNFVFVHGMQSKSKPGRHILTVPDINKSEPQKSWHWFKEAVSIYNADFVYKMDADTGVCIDKLDSVLQTAAANGATYVGKIMTYKLCGSQPYCPEKLNPSWSYMSGGFYGLKSDLIKRLTRAHVDASDKNVHEDLIMGKLVWSSGIPKTYNLVCLDDIYSQCPVKHFTGRKQFASKNELC